MAESDFVSNCPVSWPINIPSIIPDIDFGGIMFSYKHGLVFGTSDKPTMMRPPSR